jgi:hypothetical protein
MASRSPSESKEIITREEIIERDWGIVFEAEWLLELSVLELSVLELSVLELSVRGEGQRDMSRPPSGHLSVEGSGPGGLQPLPELLREEIRPVEFVPSKTPRCRC